MTNLASLARPDGKKERISSFQTADEIREQLQRAEYNSRPFSRKVATFFKKSDDYETCRNLWAWLIKNIHYEAEPKEDQNAKTIERFIVDGYGDCKHYATTIVGVLNACGIPAWFRLVSQDKEKPNNPNHAYACALVGHQIVIIDPCRKKRFNDECRFIKKWDYAPIKKNEIMALHYLSGDEAEIGKRSKSGGGKRQEKKQQRKEKRAEKKQQRKGKQAANKEKRKTRRKKIAKVGLAPARAAFLALIDLNGLKIATKLARVYKKNPADLQSFWTKFGGDFNKLKQAIAKGSKQQISGDQIGVAIETTIALATPILIAVAALIKKHNAEGDATEASAFDAGVNKGKEDLANDPDIDKGSANMPEDKDVGLVKKKGEGDDTQMGSFFSPLGLFFKTPLLLSMFHPQNSVIAFLIALISTYCAVGLLIFPFYQWNWLGLRRFVALYIELPKLLFNGTIKKIFS